MIKQLRYLCTLLLMAVAGVSWADTVTDVINKDVTSSLVGETGQTAWTDITLQGTSGAEYVIHTMGLTTDDYAIRWNKNGYLYASKSGGKVKSITITGASKSVDIYASNSAYSAKATATKITSLTASETGATYEFETDYSFVAINGTTSSTQITSIEIVWEEENQDLQESDLTLTSPSTISIASQGTSQISYSTSSTGAITWTSMNPSIATVDNGIVTGAETGTTIVTLEQAADANYKVGTANVIVKVVEDGEGVWNAGFTTKIENGLKLDFNTDNVVATYLKGDATADPYSDNDEIRVYKGSKLTFDVPDGYKITNIAFTCTSNDYATALSNGTANEGTLTADAASVTWTGVAQSVEIDNSNAQARIIKIVVTYGDGSDTPVATVPAPTFNPAAGEVEAGTTVVIVCPAEADGVEYRIGTEGDFVEYSDPIVINEATTIYARAYDADGNYSDVVSAAYTIKQDTPEPAYETVTMPYEVDFTKGQDKFVIEDATLPEGLTYIWSEDTRYGMKASAYANSTAYASESWLVSPLVDLTKNTGEANLTFEHAINKFESVDKAKEEATVWVREEGGEWSQVSINYPETLSWSFVQGGTVDLSSYNGKKIQIGFKYVSTAAQAGTWEIKNFNIVAVELTEAGLSYGVDNYIATIGEENDFPVLQNPNNLSGITYRVANESYATIDATTGDITLVAPGQTTVYAEFAGNDEFKEGQASYLLVVKEKATVGTDKYELVSDVSTLASGDIIIIVDNDKLKAISTTQNSNNRAATDVEEEADETIKPSSLVAIIELGGETDAWTFNVTNGEKKGYLYAAGGTSNNYLRTEDEADNKAKASIAIDEEGLATILFNIEGTESKEARNKLRYNDTNGGIFACYGTSSNTGSPVRIYRKVTSTETVKGDVNGDGSPTIADVTALVNIILGKVTTENNPDNYNFEAADVNNDGSPTIADVTELVNIILGKTN